MTHELSVIEARRLLTSLPLKFAHDKSLQSVTVTRHGKPVMAILPHELYESIIETLEVLNDPHLSKALKRSLKELKSGKTIPWHQAKEDLLS